MINLLVVAELALQMKHRMTDSMSSKLDHYKIDRGLESLQ
jgi:hypothetical protein